MRNLAYIGVIILMIGACVPARQVEDLKAKKSKCEEEVGTLRASTLEMTTKNKELNDDITAKSKDIDALKRDTLTLGTSIRRLQTLYNELMVSYDKLNANNEKLLSSNQNETKKVINQLQMTQEELQKKEDALKKLEGELNAQRADLDKLSGDLKDREQKVNELQQILASKDSIVSALKKTVSDALVGFTNNGLTVEQKNGKVYVSMEERLLFATGSFIVDKDGKEAVKKLGKVLENNPDINILIEGHTDNVPMKGSGEIKDNWDLSVMRATSVVKIITSSSSVNPTRLTAAGRGEFSPVDKGNSAEARKKNRRIEIILSPKLDEIFKVIETN
ncbi:MAG: OmpA family protein [Bacteroidota bacterium]